MSASVLGIPPPSYIMFSRPLRQKRQEHREMLHETASPSSSRSIPRPSLPPSLHLTIPKENGDSSNRPRGSELTKKSFNQAFHHIVFRRRLGTVNRLERMAEVTVEDENAVCNTRTSNSINRRTTGRPTSLPSTSSIISQSTVSHISTPRIPRTLITSFPPLNVSDIPPRSPTNKSPFSAVLLAGEDEEHDEDDPALALWHTEQLHRARLAKLTKHLGEEIPAELVLSPSFLSHGTSCSSVHSRRGGYHHRRKSFDHSSSKQVSSTEEKLRRSKSLKEQGKTHRTPSVAGITPEMSSTVYITGGVRSTETTTNTVLIPNPALSQSTTPETWHTDSPMGVPNGGVLHERVSMDAYSDSHPSHSSRPSVETSSEASSLFLRTSCAPPKSEKLHRRPATINGSRRVEKLANFFGVDHDDVPAVPQAREVAQKLQSSSASAAGDLAIGIRPPKSQLEVDVKVSKSSRFWNGRVTTKSVHPDDVMDKLRMMKAS